MRTLPLILAACTAGTTATDDTTDTAADHPFVPYEGDAEVDPVATFLCADALDPESVEDTTFIDCDVEGANYAAPGATPDGPFTVMVWNLERGQRITQQLEAWESGDLPVPDILLASEVDRGCSRSGSRNVPRDIAEALGLNYVFGVEFVELPRGGGSGGTIAATCEHGNAIFSRFPLGNVRSAFHDANVSWYIPPEERGNGGEPRLGGRSYVEADVDLGDGTYLRLYSLHFESRVLPPENQPAQGQEIADLAAASPIPVIVGGDTNSVGYTADVFDGDAEVLDPTIGPWVDAGLTDAHASLDPEDRGTRSGLVIDLLFGRGVTWSDPEVCDGALCDDLSDHRAVWADATVP